MGPFEIWKNALVGLGWPYLGSSINRLYFWRPHRQSVFLQSNLSDAGSLQRKQWRIKYRMGWSWPVCSSGFFFFNLLHDENLVSIHFHCESCPSFSTVFGLCGVLWFCGSKLRLNLQTAGGGSICNRNKSVSPCSTQTWKEKKAKSSLTAPLTSRSQPAQTPPSDSTRLWGI